MSNRLSWCETDLGDAGRDDRVGASDDEDQRLAVLRSYGILDSAAEAVFDELTLLAAELCDTPMATITLVDENRQWFKSRIGVEHQENLRDHSLCARALHSPDPLIIDDARLDARFDDNPLVHGRNGIRFYAGAPLISPEGLTLGTLCVMDTEPRVLSDRRRDQLVLLARQVMAHLDARRHSQRMAAEIVRLRSVERDLTATDRLLRGVLAYPEAAVYAKDLDGRYILGNGSLHALMRAEPGSMMGRCDRDLMADDVADAFRRTDQEVVRRGEQLVRQETLTRPDGSTRQYLSTKFPLRREDGTIYAVAGVSTDITEQVGASGDRSAAELRWRTMFDEAPVGIGVCDENGVVVTANSALCTFLGRSRHEVVGARGLDFSHPDDRGLLRDAGRALQVDTAGVVQLEQRFVQPDGEVRWTWLTLARTPGPAGHAWTLVHSQDVTQRLAGERVIRDSEANLSEVAEVVEQIQTGSDARQAIVAACAALARARYACLWEPGGDGPGQLELTRSTAGELVGLLLTRERPSAIWSTFDTGEDGIEPGGHVFPSSIARGTTVLTIPVRSATSTVAVLVLGFDRHVPPAADRRHEVIRLLAAQAAVAIRQTALLADLAARAVTDPLTGLPNRRGWNDALDRLIRDGEPDRRTVVALVDFDHFKQYNDTRGHAAGDDLLRDFAERARAVLRGADVLARWGGEEFALALPWCEADAADHALRRVLASMPAGQTCSIGYTELTADHDLAQAMIEADAALYVAKTSGRNQIRRF